MSTIPGHVPQAIAQLLGRYGLSLLAAIVLVVLGVLMWRQNTFGIAGLVGATFVLALGVALALLTLWLADRWTQDCMRYSTICPTDP